jgi:hypothetical protein
VEGGSKNSSKLSVKNYIDVTIDEEGGWRFTGIYGEPEWNRKVLTWEAIRSLKGEPAIPWLIMGDFNEILYNSEKEGGRPRPRDNYNHLMIYCLNVSLMIWVLGEICLHGEEAKYESDWIGQLQTHHGRSCLTNRLL